MKVVVLTKKQFEVYEYVRQGIVVCNRYRHGNEIFSYSIYAKLKAKGLIAFYHDKIHAYELRYWEYCKSEDVTVEVRSK